MCSIPGSGRSAGEGKGNQTSVFLPGESCGQRSLVDYSLCRRKESGTTAQLSMHASILTFKTKYGPKHKVKNRLFTCSDLFETESRSVVSESLPRHGPYSPWSSPGQNTGVGSLSLLQGIFPTQGSNPGLPYCRWILYQLSRKGSPRTLEWVACPCSSQSSRPKMGRGSPALHVDSLPTELSGNCSIIPGVYF